MVLKEGGDFIDYYFKGLLKKGKDKELRSSNCK
jgi:hypothetical protein